MNRQGRGAAVVALRRRIAAIEQGMERGPGRAPLTLGVPGIDGGLPGGGLARGGLHEVLGGHGKNDRRDAAQNVQQNAYQNIHEGGAALAFAAVLAARRAVPAGNQDGTNGGRVLWCPARRGLYGPGLAAFGLAPGQLLLVHGRDDQQRLWAMEEGLKCTGLAMVVGEVGRLGLGQSRRLQLAAEASGVTALLLHAGGGGGDAGLGVSAGLTRWRISSAPSAPTKGYAGIGAPRCRAELLRCKGGRPGEWLLQWNGDGFSELGAGDQQYEHDHEHGHEYDGERRKTCPVPVAAPMADGPAVPGLAARA